MKRSRLYSMFQKMGRRWVRLCYPSGKPYPAYRKDHAIVIFQDALIAGLGELRPVKDEIEPAAVGTVWGG